MAIANFKCERCDKSAVCKVLDILKKFHDDAKTPLGVNITLDGCFNFASDAEPAAENGEADEN